MSQMLQIIEIKGEEEFERRVLKGPKETTFVVDFWAPWCGPCQTLAPVLERAVSPFADRAVIVKVNVDESRDLSTLFRIASIPLVMAFRAGQVVGQFVGALPEGAIRKTVSEWIPSGTDDAVALAEALIDQGKTDEAAARLGDVLKDDPEHHRARVLLAQLSLDGGDAAEAQRLASQIPLDSAEYDAAQGVLARVRFVQVCQEAGGRSACAMRLGENDDDLDARFQLACCMAADGDYELALDGFLECVRRDRRHNDEAARKAMIALFGVLGSDDPLVRKYRSDLSRVLFS